AYAQSTKAKDDQLRDTALKLLNELENKNLAEAKKHAAALVAGKGGPGGKKGTVALHKLMKLEDVMHQFTTETSGGFGYESEFEELADEKNALKAPQIDELVLKAYKTAT